jgi:hypothetical protein
MSKSALSNKIAQEFPFSEELFTVKSMRCHWWESPHTFNFIVI